MDVVGKKSVGTQKKLAMYKPQVFMIFLEKTKEAVQKERVRPQ